jgi:hypothetical protein
MKLPLDGKDTGAEFYKKNLRRLMAACTQLVQFLTTSTALVPVCVPRCTCQHVTDRPSQDPVEHHQARGRKESKFSRGILAVQLCGANFRTARQIRPAAWLYVYL